MTASTSLTSWRTVDVVTCAVIGVAFGVVFWAWNLLWAAAGPAFAGFPPLQAFMYGTWLLPVVVAPLIIRKPGAAVFAETVAATVSALLGAQWGLLTVIYGLMQGGAAELVFAFTLYRVWRLPVALLAAAAAGAAAWLLDVAIFYAEWAVEWTLVYAGLLIPSSIVIAGVGGWFLVRAIAETGVLSIFPSGRSQRPV
jgi:energy-coupling factor transport system substrate-specific component